MADRALPSVRRWRLRGFLGVVAFLLLGLGVLTWFLPAIAVHAGLTDQAVKRALPWFRGQVSLSEISLGWFSPVRVRGIVIRSEQGETLAEIGEAATSKTLLALCLNSQNLGEIQLGQPVIHCTVRPGGSNWEDALAPYFESESSGGVDCVIQVVQGQCILRGEGSSQETVLSALDATLHVPAAAGQFYQFDAVTQVAVGPEAGQWSVSGEWRPGATPAGLGKVQYESRGVPLAALAPVFLHSGMDADLQGRADARSELILGEDGHRTLRVEHANVDRLGLRAPEFLGKDELRLARFEISGEATLTDQELTLHRGNLDCDVGRLQISGAAPWAAFSASRFISALRKTRFDANGEVDLAQLAQRLPQTLRLRDGLTVTSGTVRLACSTRDEDDRRRWEGTLEASGLAAEHQGKRISWERPLSASFAVRDVRGGPVIDQFACQSDFFRAAGRGSLAEGALSLEGDLSKLAAELQRFINLGAMQFGGAVQGELQWSRADEGQTAAQGNLRLTDFQWAVPGRRPWREPQLAVTFSAAGLMNEQGARRLDRGLVELNAAGDSASVRLLTPVDMPSQDTIWPLHCEARGELASWLPRLENVAALPDWHLEGRISLNADGAMSARQAQLEKIAVTLESFYLQGPGLIIREPRIEAQGDLTWNGPAQIVAMNELTLAAASVAFRAHSVSLNLAPGQVAATGDIDFRGDLQRIGQWRQTPAAAPHSQFAGMAVGRLRAHMQNRTIQIQGTTDIENFVYSMTSPPVGGRVATPAAKAVASSVLWEETRLRLACDAAYDPDRQTLDARQLSLAGESLSLGAQGKITDLGGVCRVDLTGQHDYDLAKLLTRLRPWIGPELKMAGRGPRPFTLQGPLFVVAESAGAPQNALLAPPELKGSTSVAWTSAEYKGIKSGAGEAPVHLEGGIVSLGPLDLPVSDGRLTMAPKLALNATPMVLLLDAGPVLQNVRISPEMCRTWLKYVAPLVADATQAEGKFSIDLTHPAQVALHEPMRSELHGLMKVHAAQVGPGPLSRQVLALVDQVKAAAERKPLAPAEKDVPVWLNLSEQALPFDVAGGRVYHRDLSVTAKDVVIRTRGSVGLDQTLDLMAEVPIQDRWIEGEPLLAGFRGQTLQIPVGGSLGAPRPDPRGIEGIARQMFGNAAKRLLEDNLKINPDVKNALDRLFRGK